MESLYIVRTPFQALSALEAREHFKDEEATLVVRQSPEELNNRQMEEVVLLGRWRRVERIQTPFISQLRHFNELSILRQLRKRAPRYKHIFGADFPSHYFESLPNECSYLIDDGTYTLAIQDSFRQAPSAFQIDETRKDLTKHRVLRAMGMAPGVRRVMPIFTCFALEPVPNQILVKHDFSSLRKLILADARDDDETVYFLGSNFVEDGTTTLDAYVSRVSDCLRHYKGKRFVYMPHRRESAKTLARIGAIEGVRVEFPALPVEAEFVRRRVRPKYVAAILSTALYTLKLIFPDAEVRGFRLRQNDINPQMDHLITPIYSYLGSYVSIVEG